jgi:hypothetical protein
VAASRAIEIDAWRHRGVVPRLQETAGRLAERWL